MTHSYLPLILTGFMGTGKSTIGKCWLQNYTIHILI